MMTFKSNSNVFDVLRLYFRLATQCHCSKDVKVNAFFNGEGRRYNRDFSPLGSVWQEIESVPLARIQQPEAVRQREEWEERWGRRNEEEGGEMSWRGEQAEGTFSNNILSAETLHMSALQKFPHHYLSHIPSKSFTYSFDLTFLFSAYCKLSQTGYIHF